MSERVSVSIRDGVADVRLNRPEKMNALDDAMFDGLIDTGRKLADDTSLRAVVLSGEGRAFCAGLDMSSFASIASTADSQPRDDDSRPARGLLSKQEGSIANRAQRAGWVWQEVPVPVIAAIHGVAYGGGLQVALGADIRFIAPDARMSILEIKWGLVPDMSGTQTLRRLLPLDVIKELTFTGRIVSGSQAVELGLATHVSDTPREAAHELAREIAGKSPSAIRAAKKLLNESGLIPVEEGLSLEATQQLSVIGKPNQVEAIKANLQKRDPQFQDPE